MFKLLTPPEKGYDFGTNTWLTTGGEKKLDRAQVSHVSSQLITERSTHSRDSDVNVKVPETAIRDLECP